MRFSILSAVIAANLLGAATQKESLSAFVEAIPKCSLPAFAKALTKESCDTTTISNAILSCLYNKITNISGNMAQSKAVSELDADYLNNELSLAKSSTGLV